MEQRQLGFAIFSLFELVDFAGVYRQPFWVSVFSNIKLRKRADIAHASHLYGEVSEEVNNALRPASDTEYQNKGR